MKLTFKTEDMYASLDKFDVGYSYPVSVSICNMTGFFASNKNIHAGFAAISARNSLIIADYNVLMAETLYEIPMKSVRSLKISKALLLGVQTVKIEFLSDGKKCRLDVNIAPKVLTGEFPEQKENMVSFIDTLKGWA